MYIYWEKAEDLNFLNIWKTKWNSVGESGNQHEPVQVKNVKNGNFPHFSLHIHNFSDLFQAFFFGNRYDFKKYFFNIFWPKIGQNRKFEGKKCGFFEILAGKNFQNSKFLKIVLNHVEMISGLKMAQNDPKWRFLTIYIHLTSHRPKLPKSIFWPKIDFLRFSWNFDDDRFSCKNARKSAKIMQNFENVFFTSPRCL